MLGEEWCCFQGMLPILHSVNQNLKGECWSISATHGVSPTSNPQSSTMRLSFLNFKICLVKDREGANVDRETGDILDQERQAREAYGGEVDGLRCERHLCEAKNLCTGAIDHSGGCDTHQ